MKALKVVGTVVAVVAVAASAVATFGGSLGIAAGAVAAAKTVATVAGLAMAGFGVASAVFAPKPGFSREGNPLNFQTNPQSGLPYPIGRTRMSGVRIHADTYDAPAYKSESKQDVLSFAVLLGAGGPMEEIETFHADKEAVTFNAGSGNAIGTYADWMAQKVSLGLAGASALALSFGGVAFPGWSADHRLTGISHALWDLRYDAKGEHFGAGVPEPEWIGKWAKVYDPRLDSTYPGGSGAHRALDESTFEWSANPALHALTWCLGRWQNGKRTLGIGAPVDNIRVADFVEAANIADANEWSCGGVEWSTDSKWSVLKRMLQAGGAEPTMTGAMIGCRVNAPRVSIATVTADKLLDSLSIAATRSRRDRFNTVIPRYRSEEHDWEVISGTPVAVAEYITEDGGVRTKEVDFPLVQHEGAIDGNAQAGQLAAYEIVNSREAGPIRFTTGPEFVGVKTGDVVTLDVPDEGLDAQPVLIRSRSIDPTTFKITFEAETESAAKHDFALGKTTIPPPTWEPKPPDLTPPTPNAVLWALTAGYAGEGIPAITVAGACEFPGADAVLIEYRAVGATDWLTLGKAEASAPVRHVVSPVEGATQHEARVAYQSGNRVGPWLARGPVTTPAGLTLDAHLAPSDVLYVPAGTDGAVTSYAAAAGTFIITSSAGTDISSNFMLSTPAGGNPDGLTVGYVARAFSVTGGIASSSSEDQVTLTIRATGSGDYAGIVIDRRLMIVKDYGTAIIPFVANANDRNGLTPDTPGGTLSLSHVLLPSGNVRIKGTVTFTHNADPDHKNNIDGFEVGLYSALTNDGHTMDGTAADEDWRYVISDLSESSHEFVFAPDVAGNRFYKVGVRAVRQVHTDVAATGFIKSGIKVNSSLYQPETAQNNTGNIGGVSATLIATATSNFNADNDGNGLTPTAATSVSMSSGVVATGSALVQISWAYTNTSNPALANHIDGFLVGLYRKPGSASWTYSGSFDDQMAWKEFDAFKRKALFDNLPATDFCWGVVIPFRRVRTDISTSGLLIAAAAQSPAGSGHRPSSVTDYTGDRILAVNTTTVVGIVNSSTDNVANAKVVEGSILDGAINVTGYTRQGGTVTYATDDAFATIVDASETVDAGGELVVTLVLPNYLEVIDPEHLEVYAIDVRLLVQHNGTLAATYSDYYRYSERWDAPDTIGAFDFEQNNIVIEHKFTGLAAGNYSVGYYCLTPASNGAVQPQYRYQKAFGPRAAQ